MTKRSVKKRNPAGSSLFTICHPAREGEDIRPLLVDMCRIVLREGLEGLSANQLGENVQAFVTNVRGDGIRIFVDPILTITDYDQEPIMEKCASRRIEVERLRHRRVMLDALNYSGERVLIDTDAPKYSDDVAFRLSARFQHEMEHMFGLCTKEEPSLEQTSLADLLEEPVPLHRLHLPLKASHI